MKNQGRPLGENRGYIAKGFFNSWEEIAASPVQTFSDVQPGDVRYEDINKDGQIDVNDMVPIGYGDIPRIMYGINLGVGYKGFSITALFQGAAKVSHQYSDIVMNLSQITEPYLSINLITGHPNTRMQHSHV